MCPQPVLCWQSKHSSLMLYGCCEPKLGVPEGGLRAEVGGVDPPLDSHAHYRTASFAIGAEAVGFYVGDQLVQLQNVSRTINGLEENALIYR